MSKTITLNLRKDLIFEAVKSESYDKGRLDKSVDPVKNAAAGMTEQAGGEGHQERQLLRSLKATIGKFGAQMAEFLDAAEGSYNDTLSASSDEFTITLIVNDRYNDGLATPMSSLCEDYLINHMLFVWWQSRNQEYSKSFVVSAQDSLDHIRLCLSKTAPAASTSAYTDVTGTVTPNP